MSSRPLFIVGIALKLGCAVAMVLDSGLSAIAESGLVVGAIGILPTVWRWVDRSLDQMMRLPDV